MLLSFLNCFSFTHQIDINFSTNIIAYRAVRYYILDSSLGESRNRLKFLCLAKFQSHYIYKLLLINTNLLHPIKKKK